MAETRDMDDSGSKILEGLLRSSKNNTASTNIRKTPPSQSPAIYRIKPRPRDQMGPAKEARVCSCHTVHEEKLSVPKTKSKKHGKKQDHFPNLKIFSNGKMDSNGARKLPGSTSCAPVVPDISEMNTYGVTGGEMIREISRIMELTRSGNLMEREIAHRLATLKRLTADAENQLSGVTPSQARHGAAGPAAQGLAWDPETLGGGTDPGSRAGGGQQGQGARGGDPMLVLRPSPVVPELSDVPPLEDLLTVPTSFTEATRMVFALRQDMLTLRNVLLKWSCARATDEIEKFRARGRAKDQVLLRQLGSIFSAPQLAYMRDGGKRGLPWTPGDYLRTIGLRSLCSYQAFQYVTQTMKIPLPSMHAVRSMANSGIFPEVTRQYEELRQAKEMAFALGKSGKQPSKKRPKDEDDGGGGTPQRRTESERGPRTRGGGRGGGKGRGTPSAKRRRSDSDWEPEMLQSASRRSNTKRDSHQERSNSVSDQERDSDQGSDQEEGWDPDDSDQELPHDWDQEPAQSTPRRPSWSAALLQAGAERTWSDGEGSDEAGQKVDFPVRVPAMNAPLTSGRGRGRGRGRGSRGTRGVRGGRGRQRAGRAEPGEVRSMGAKGAKWKQSQYNALGAVADMSEDERLQSDSDGDAAPHGRAPDREREEGRYDGRASPGRGWTGHQAWSHESPRRRSPKKKRAKSSKRDRAMRV